MKHLEEIEKLIIYLALSHMQDDLPEWKSMEQWKTKIEEIKSITPSLRIKE